MAEEITHDLVLAEMADLVADLNEQWAKPAGELNFCTLNGPQQLTVMGANGALRQEMHYGGEDFVPIEAYTSGKSIVVRFAPRDAANYVHMEHSAGSSLDDLSGFSILAVTDRGTYEARIREIERKRSVLREKSRMKSKFETYKDLGFGSF